MLDPSELIGHWGYAAIFLVVALGNAGVPAPEDATLAAGYLVWRKQLRLMLVLAVGIASAVAGDNFGYWIERRYGREAIERYGHWVLLTPARLEATRRFMSRYGSLGVFAARFIPGLRSMAGPLAGGAGLPFAAFFPANLLGAAVSVPWLVGLGYAVGYGFGSSVEKIRPVVGKVEHIVLIVATVGMMGVLGWRAVRVRRAGGS